jgi:hypothetical protein
MLANIGIPMIFVQWPLMACALIPVIVVEALLIRRWVSLSYREAFAGIAKANFLSTAVGIPLAWGIMLAIEFAVLWPVAMAADRWDWKLDSPALQVFGFLVSIAWLGPMEGHLLRLIPIAAALLLIPCFYVSVWLERRACLRSWPFADPSVVRRGVYLTNLASYALLFAVACGWIAVEYFAKTQ